MTVMKRLAAAILVVPFALVWTATAEGAGFLVFEQGAKAMGMAGAFTAQADDPSGIFNNAAGISQIPGSRVSVGNTFVRNDQKYDVDRATVAGDPYHEEMASRTFYLPHLYVTHQLDDRLTLGFGAFSPFGIGTDWPDNAVGNTVANEASIKTYDLNPNLALRVGPKLSVAVGLHYTRATIQIQRNVGGDTFVKGLSPVASWELLGAEQFGRLKVDARAGGWAYNVGLLYRLNEFWKAGFSYRGHTKLEVSRNQGAVKWTPSSKTLADLAVLNPLLALVPVNPLVATSTRGYTRLSLPGIFLAGISTTAIPDWTLEFDLQYTTWNHFDDIQIQVEPPLQLHPALVTAGLAASASVPVLSTMEEDWENTWGFHLGAEYRYNDHLAARAGYFFDKNPVPDRTLGAILPDADRHNFSLGFGYTRGPWTVDAAYMWSHFENRTTHDNYQGFNASYRTDFHLLGVTVTRAL